MRLIIQPDYARISMWTANYVASKIIDFKPTPDKPFVLGLPTGSSPLGLYRHLVELYMNKVISFENIITFNTDEYVGLPKNHPHSLSSFMWTNFFNHINIKPENVFIPDGSAENLKAECASYEQKIKDVGGINLIIGGVGPDGHIAFNEPGSSLSSRTRTKMLTMETIIANSRFFDNNINKVPKNVITVGVGTIMDAQEVLIMASGHNKARALYQAVEGAINHLWTISALQMHAKSIIVCDEDSTTELKVGTYRYFKEIEKEHIKPDSLLMCDMK